MSYRNLLVFQSFGRQIFVEMKKSLVLTFDDYAWFCLRTKNRKESWSIIVASKKRKKKKNLKVCELFDKPIRFY